MVQQETKMIKILGEECISFLHIFKATSIKPKSISQVLNMLSGV